MPNPVEGLVEIYEDMEEVYAGVGFPAGSPSRDGDFLVYVLHKPTELAHSFLVCSYFYFRLCGHFNCI